MLLSAESASIFIAAFTILVVFAGFVSWIEDQKTEIKKGD